MSERIGIIMNGVTGRMGTNQHLVRSVLALREEGGIRLKDGRQILPEPVLVGRNREKLEALACAHGITRVATELDAALAGLTRCWIQPKAATPKPVWNPDERRRDDFFGQWQEVPENEAYPNGFKAQWELYLRHVLEDGPFAWDLLAGDKGVQLAELGYRSWAERRWLDVPELRG